MPGLVLTELDYWWCHERLAPEAWLLFLEDLLGGAYRTEQPTRDDLAAARHCSASTPTSV